MIFLCEPCSETLDATSKEYGYTSTCDICGTFKNGGPFKSKDLILPLVKLVLNLRRELDVRTKNSCNARTN